MERKELTKNEMMVFLKLVSQLASRATFERKLNISASDIEFYKRSLGIETQDEARKLLKKLEFSDENSNVVEEIQKARKAEATANDRLQELEKQKRLENSKAAKKVDPNALHEEDSKRQKRFNKQQLEEEQAALVGTEEWNLPVSGNIIEKAGTIERFRKDIQNGGMTFCIKKYGVTAKQIKVEALRLGIRVNWDLVKR